MGQAVLLEALGALVQRLPVVLAVVMGVIAQTMAAAAALEVMQVLAVPVVHLVQVQTLAVMEVAAAAAVGMGNILSIMEVAAAALVFWDKALVAQVQRVGAGQRGVVVVREELQGLVPVAALMPLVVCTVAVLDEPILV